MTTDNHPEPMLTIFNGRRRTLSGEGVHIYAQLNVEFRQYLHILKGAKLSVFLAICLHANRHGWAWPGMSLLSKETGYNEQTVSIAANELVKIKIAGQRILLKYQPKGGGSSTFETNHYLIFPSEKETELYSPKIQLGLPHIDFPCTVEPCTDEPATVEPSTVNLPTKESHIKGDPRKEEEPRKKQAAPIQASYCYLHDITMTSRSKNGETWYSHKIDGGGWCKGVGNKVNSPAQSLEPCACGRYTTAEEKCEHGCAHCCELCWEDLPQPKFITNRP